MTKKSITVTCWAVIGASILLANYAAQHAWPLWTITITGAVFLATVVTYLLTAQSPEK